MHALYSKTAAQLQKRCYNHLSSYASVGKEEVRMKNIKLLDGATGTMLWEKAQAAGLEKVSTWRYNVEAPQLVADLHSQYIAAGSQIIYTNTFCANRPAVSAEGFEVTEIIKSAVLLAKQSAKESGKASDAPKVALDFGPLMNPMEPFGTTTAEDCRRIYREMCQAGKGADLIVLETFMDAASLAIAAEEALETGLPVLCSMSFDKGSRTFFGDGIDLMLKSLPKGVSAVGLNCSFGPEKAVPVIKEFSEKTDLPLLLKPNTADLDPQAFAKELLPALPLVSYLGACCGSSPEYIKALKKLAE